MIFINLLLFLFYFILYVSYWQLITSITLPMYAMVAVGICSVIGCYMRGDFGEFIRALGVAVIILYEKAQILSVLMTFSKKVQ